MDGNDVVVLVEVAEQLDFAQSAAGNDGVAKDIVNLLDVYLPARDLVPSNTHLNKIKSNQIN